MLKREGLVRGNLKEGSCWNGERGERRNELVAIQRERGEEGGEY